MDLTVLLSLLKSFEGATFATLDAETHPQPGVRCVMTGERVIMFTNQNGSGYENMVKRRLVEAGKNPDSFTCGDLPWGERVPNTPIIMHKGEPYVQVIILSFGQRRYFIGEAELTAEQLGIERPRDEKQGLDKESQVHCRVYKLEHITSIRMLGQDLGDDGGQFMLGQKRSTLRIKHPE